MKPEIVILEGRLMFAQLIAELLQQSFPGLKVSTTTCMEDALVRISATLQSVYIVGAGMATLEVSEAIRHLKAANPGCLVIVITPHEHEVFREEAVDAGAFGTVAEAYVYRDLVPVLSTCLREIDEE